MKPTISIIVPVYKVESYLSRCLDSVLAQTFTDFELIAVDDGSPDNCGKICEEYAKKDHRIKVIHQENGGLSAARNAGLDMARGEYIGFVDSDDYIAADMYETLLHTARTYRADLVECAYYTVDRAEKTVVGAGGTETGDNLFALRRLIEHRAYDVAWNKLYKSRLFSGLRFPPGKIYEDSFIMYKVFLQARKYAYVGTGKYYYTIRETGIMRQQRTYSRKNLCRLEYYEERYHYLTNHTGDRSIIDTAEYEYLAELLYHLNMAINNRGIDPDKILRKKIRAKLLKNYHGFMTNPLVTKKHKLWMVLMRTNEKLFEFACRFRRRLNA